VHDARLVALMMCSGVKNILTLNKRDFARYAEVIASSPEDVIGGTVGQPAS
jgi:hypothetical protein